MHSVHEYKSLANVKSGQRSQEITFDFISAEAGIYRQAETSPGQRREPEVFPKGYHPFAVQGDATLFDDVRVPDLGP